MHNLTRAVVLSLLLTLPIPTLKSDHSGLFMTGAAIGLCATGYLYAKSLSALAYAQYVLRNEREWASSFFSPFTENDRLICRWAEDRWPTAHEITSAFTNQRKIFCKELDIAARGGYKSRYTGNLYYLVAFVDDLERELTQLANLSSSLLLTRYLAVGLRSSAQNLIQRIDHYRTRGLALKRAILARHTYQSQIKDMRRREDLGLADHTIVNIHTGY